MRPVERVLGALEVTGGPDGSGEYRAFCPAHEDSNTPNLRVREGEDGHVLLRCFAGCDQVRVLEALEKRSIGRAKLFAGREEAGGGGGTSNPSNTAATVQLCTLATYAEARKLPIRSLERLGLSDARYAGKRAVRTPYLQADGTEGAVRFRLALEKNPEGDDRFHWRKGSKLSLYGLWRLEHVRDEGYAFLVEGESDCRQAGRQ